MSQRVSKRVIPLHRRTVLKCAGITGVAIALPPLEAMMDSKGRLASIANAQAVPKKMVLFHWGNGAERVHWEPSKLGANWWGNDASPQVPMSLQPLAEKNLLKDVNILTGLSSIKYFMEGSGDEHEKTISSHFTCTRSTGNRASGPSLDQVVSNTLGSGSSKSPLLVRFKDGSNAYSLSWTPSVSAPSFKDEPATIFDDLFKDFSAPSATPNPAESTASQISRLKKKSILDYVRSSLESVTQRVSTADRKRIDDHLSAIRELEKNVTATTTTGPSPACRTPAKPGSTNDPTLLYKTLIDLVYMSLLCDIKVSAIYGVVAATTGFILPFRLPNGQINTQFTDHGLSHLSEGGGDEAYRKSLWGHSIRWKIEQFAYLLEKMKAPLANGASMLDNSIVIASSEMSQGDWHSVFNLPVIAAGKVNNMATGQHIVFPCGTGYPGFGKYHPELMPKCQQNGAYTSIANLWLTAAKAMGVGISKFGDDGTQTLPGLW